LAAASGEAKTTTPIPADLIWDHTGFGVRFRDNGCGTSIPGGLCH
jgi:hypothetical protein